MLWSFEKCYYINTLKQEFSTAKTYEHNRLDETSVVDKHRCHMTAKFGVFVDEDHSKLPTLYRLPKLHKRPYKSRFIANSIPCTTTELSILLTSCLTVIKNHIIKYCTTVYERNGKKLFWSIKNSAEVHNKLSSKSFLASSLSSYDFSTLYTTLFHNLIKEKLTELIEHTFNIEDSLYLACSEKWAFLLLNNLNNIGCCHVRKCAMLSIIFWTIYLKDLARNDIDKLIPMGTNCAPLVTYLYLF